MPFTELRNKGNINYVCLQFFKYSFAATYSTYPRQKYQLCLLAVLQILLCCNIFHLTSPEISIMSASSSSNTPLLQHIPPTLASPTILTPPPSPHQSGGWWVPEETMSRCSSCLVLGPLTPLF